MQRYRLKSWEDSGSGETLTLLDTPGYGEAGASPKQFAETLDAVRNADLVLLVMDAKSPAKQADGKLAEDLADWFRDHPEYKPPPIVGVVNKIDTLSPVMEWEPPYDWRDRGDRRRKAFPVQWITFGKSSAGRSPPWRRSAPIARRNRVYGIDEFLLPAMTALLSEVRAVSLVKALHRDYEQAKFQRVCSRPSAPAVN